jgi:hypothetical protein
MQIFSPRGIGTRPPDLTSWAAGNSSSAELGYANSRSTITGLELARITEDQDRILRLFVPEPPC